MAKGGDRVLKVRLTAKEYDALVYVSQFYDRNNQSVDVVGKNIIMSFIRMGLAELKAEVAKQKAGAPNAETTIVDSSGNAQKVREPESPASNPVEGQKESSSS